MFQRVLKTPLQQFISNFCSMGFRHNFALLTSGISNEIVRLNIESWKTLVETYEKSVPLIDPDQFLREVNNKVYKSFMEIISKYTNGNTFVKTYIKEVLIFIILQNGLDVLRYFIFHTVSLPLSVIDKCTHCNSHSFTACHTISLSL